LLWLGQSPAGADRAMACSLVSVDELVEHWTLVEDERALVAGKSGGTRLGFAVLRQFYTQHGRFLRGRFELPGEVVEFVARQVEVPASESGAYECSGRTIECRCRPAHRPMGPCVLACREWDTERRWLFGSLCRPNGTRPEGRVPFRMGAAGRNLSGHGGGEG
jgi:hypothetical protein